MYGRLKAQQLWDRYRLEVPVDLKRLAADLRIEVISFRFRGRIKEMIVDGVIGVEPGLPRPWFRWYVAHAIGHHVLHVGTSFYLESWQWVNHAKAELQAEEFAARLLGGPEGSRLTAEELRIPDEKLPLVHMQGTDERHTSGARRYGRRGGSRTAPSGTLNSEPECWRQAL